MKSLIRSVLVSDPDQHQHDPNQHHLQQRMLLRYFFPKEMSCKKKLAVYCVTVKIEKDCNLTLKIND